MLLGGLVSQGSLATPPSTAVTSSFSPGMRKEKYKNFKYLILNLMHNLFPTLLLVKDVQVSCLIQLTYQRTWIRQALSITLLLEPLEIIKKVS